MTAPTEDLIARLEKHVVMLPQGDGATCLYRNPDGPAAAQALRALQQEVERLREGFDVERYNRVVGLGFENELYALTSEYADEIEAAVRGKESTRKARKHCAKNAFKNGVKALLDRQLGDIRELIRSMPALYRSALTGSAQG